MSDSAFRERRIAPEEVQRILKRAAELSLIDADSAKSGEALTRSELEERLQALGISSEVAQKAMEPTASDPARAPDGAARVEREIQVDGMLSPDRFEEIAELIQSAMKMPGRTSAVGNKLTWTPTGLLMEPCVTVHAKDGFTTIRYVETLANRGQMAIGFGTLAGLGGLIGGGVSMSASVGIAKALEISQSSGGTAVLAIGAIVGVATAVTSFIGLNRLVAMRARTRSAFADELVARVAAAVRASTKTPAVKARVEGSASAEISEELEAEEQAEAGEKLDRA